MTDPLTDLEQDPPAKGHNRVAGVDNAVLKSIVERMENLQCSIDELKDDQKEIMAEAKSGGFATKIIRKVLRERNKDKAVREEEERLTELYMLALGML